MASHGHDLQADGSNDLLQLGPKASTLSLVLLVVGVLGVLASLGVAVSTGEGLKRFYHAYLTAYAYFFSIAMGGLFFLLIHYLVRAGWSTSIRRIPEALAATLPVMGLLTIPLLVSVFSGKGLLYNWAQPIPAHPEHTAPHLIEQLTHAKADHSAGGAVTAHSDSHADAAHTPAAGAKPVSALTKGKVVWLNPSFWTARVVFYLVFFSLVAAYFVRKSRQQDETGDHTITQRLSIVAAPLMLFVFVAFSFAAFDLLMSLDSDWYSTVFGVYYFAGSVDAMVAAVIVIAAILQRAGYLQHSVNKEHYHDLGKYLFAFTFFWGYIAFSQYMLYWYANIPDTTYWLAKRGATTNPDQLKVLHGWAVVSILLLFGRLLIPFAGLLSRHVKRNRPALVFWAIWILVFHFLDMVWIVMPEYSATASHQPGRLTLGLPELAAMIGVGGIFAGAVVWRLSSAPLRPVRDPRLGEALVFQNI
ncbi:MAG: hypothetical protein NZ561_08860 [Phycisphaerae bacterium]|nr:hypothetical protein [Phycisphaerae bacterium]MDW8263250.1 hypothetical protein [Phycisphaerales bacterium]